MASRPKRTYYIYCHTAPNGKKYIGQTHTKPEVRWSNGNGYKFSRYKSLTEAMRVTGIDRHRIVECCNGTKPSYHGSKWRYEEEN